MEVHTTLDPHGIQGLKYRRVSCIVLVPAHEHKVVRVHCCAYVWGCALHATEYAAPCTDAPANVCVDVSADGREYSKFFARL